MRRGVGDREVAWRSYAPSTPWPGRITVVSLPQAFSGLQSRLLVLVGPVGFGRGRAGRARVGLLLAGVCVDATGFHVFRGDGRRRDRSDFPRGRAVRAPRLWFRRCRTHRAAGRAPLSALRFRVDTAGPVSSLTMVPRSTAGGFACLARHEGGWGFPQPFCNERPVSGGGGMVEPLCVFILCAHWVRVLRPRARRTATRCWVPRLRALDVHQKIIAGARRPCNDFCIFTFRKGVVRFCFASFVVRLSDAAYYARRGPLPHKLGLLRAC